MKLRLLATILLLSCGITNFADAMKRSRDDQNKEPDNHAKKRSEKPLTGGGDGSGGGSGSGGADDTKGTYKEAKEKEQCGICLSEYVPEDVIRTLACTHRFHTTCINPWFTDHNTCPTCRAVEPGVSPVAMPVAIPPAITLHLAAINGNIAAVQALIAAGANVNALTAPNNWTPLHLAALRGRTDIALVLIAAGAVLNAPGGDNYTPLHFAAQSGRTAIVQALLARPGIDTTITNRYGQTALDVAANEEIRALIQTHNAAQLAVDGTEDAPE